MLYTVIFLSLYYDCYCCVLGGCVGPVGFGTGKGLFGQQLRNDEATKFLQTSASFFKKLKQAQEVVKTAPATMAQT